MKMLPAIRRLSPDSKNQFVRWAIGFALIAGSGAVSAQTDYVLTADVDIPLDAPGGGINELTMGLAAFGSVEADLGFPFGVRTIQINSSDSDSSTASGSLRCDLKLDIDPATFAATAQEITFKQSRISLDNDPSFTLDLGTVAGFIPVGTVMVNGTNLVATPATPIPPGPVTGTSFPLAPHELHLYEGTITGTASGLAANYIDPINIDLTTIPLVGPLGTGNGAVTLSAPTLSGAQVSYTVQITAPADFDALVLEDPVGVTVSTAGTVRASGLVTVDLPDFDGDNITDSLDPDDDNDDIPDTFEEAKGLDPKNAADRDLNPDGDQSTNYEEYLADTDPRNRLSDLVAEVTLVGGTPRVSFASSAARVYDLEYRDAATDGNWQPLTDNIGGTGTTIDYDDAAAAGKRLYRVAVRMP